MTADWDPSNYRDSYRDEVEQLIEAKRQGKSVVATAPEESPAPVVDLMTALEASVRKVESSTSGRGRSRPSNGKAAASRPASTRGKSSRHRTSAAKAS
jgi:DNA end-binding protein Ku